eukprot:CAMPEP_0201574232 /NCGR_PEP_ID=MMETSP0190_2-20130828/18601_1 /ASSEMBLY_ACC=CAM_ASM_000263 /TAXON_ID=37353 /ORGANISM="Rosalina sp." /LENGTH=36 /DNA_ID= /DNA_START= /DNA_END= /DNA_ORIENTATION=
MMMHHHIGRINHVDTAQQSQDQVISHAPIMAKDQPV